MSRPAGLAARHEMITFALVTAGDEAFSWVTGRGCCVIDVTCVAGHPSHVGAVVLVHGPSDRSTPGEVRRIRFDDVELSHVDRSGAARMVDVSDKEPSTRTAVATGVLRTTAAVVDLLRRDGLPKGDALATARIAGIMGAKRTPDLVPLCHPIALSGVSLDLELDAAQVRIRATVRTTDRTGVEMEALTAVAVAGLTLHDMVKAVDPAAVLDAVRVERKDGGKTGTWTRPDPERP